MGLQAPEGILSPRTPDAPNTPRCMWGRMRTTASLQAVRSERLAQEVNPLVAQFLRDRGLERSPEKTRITHIEDGGDFLGQSVRTYAGTRIIKPARKNVHPFLRHIRHLVTANQQATAGNLIAQLTPVSRGGRTLSATW